MARGHSSTRSKGGGLGRGDPGGASGRERVSSSGRAPSRAGAQSGHSVPGAEHSGQPISTAEAHTAVDNEGSTEASFSAVLQKLAAMMNEMTLARDRTDAGQPDRVASESGGDSNTTVTRRGDCDRQGRQLHQIPRLARGGHRPRADPSPLKVRPRTPPSYSDYDIRKYPKLLDAYCPD